MRSRRVLGIIALVAIVVAAVSFGIVDVTIAAASGCVGDAAECSAGPAPPTAIAFAALGAFALLVAVLPAVSWIVEVIQHNGGSPHGRRGDRRYDDGPYDARYDDTRFDDARYDE